MTVLFIGLGTMGTPMVRNLARSTEDLALFDVRHDVTRAVAAELGATGIGSLDEVPESVETVILMLPNSRIVESVLVDDHRLIERLAAGSLIVDMSSSEPAGSQRLAALAGEASIDFVDAPVSGGQRKAVTGELSIMAGGSPEAFARAKPILDTMGTSIIHVGPAGSGDAAKALNNLLSATNIAAAAEVVTAAARFGIAPETMVDVLNASTGRSQASEVKYPRHILPGSFDSGFAYGLMLKDLGIAQRLTEGLPTPLTDRTWEIAGETQRELADDADHTELVTYYESRTSIDIRHTTTERNNA